MDDELDLVRSSFGGEECSERREKEKKHGWSGACDPGTSRAAACWCERLFLAPRLRFLLESVGCDYSASQWRQQPGLGG